MKETFKAVGFFIMFLLSALPVAAADWSYDFETAKKDIGNQFHEHREVTLNDMVWKIYCVRDNYDKNRLCQRQGFHAHIWDKSLIGRYALRGDEKQQGGRHWCGLV